jgi:hypothetical protein
LFYSPFHFFHAACNSWWLFAVTVGGIEKKERLTMGHLVSCDAWMNIHLRLALIFFYPNILDLF